MNGIRLLIVLLNNVKLRGAWEVGKAYRISMGKFERKKQFARPVLRWENNIEMSLNETGWKGVERDKWQAFVYTEMKLRVP
jgi:hypothetical protein